MASEENNPPAAESGLNLLSLAPEIIENIIRHAAKEDLRNIRLASRELDRHAVRELFREVSVSPLPRHIEAYTSISQHETLRRLARSAVIYSQPDLNMDGWLGNRETEERGEDYEEAIAALARFPNLDSLEIGFTSECFGHRENNNFADVEETISVRRWLFELIFQAVRDRSATTSSPDSIRAIRRLTIVNLQNCPMPEFTRSDLFRDVMAQLDELHLEIIQETDEAGPDHDYTRVELQTFPGYLVSDWLRPISANLRALSIYSRTSNWGPFPGYFRPVGLSLPRLESLYLGYYTLAHDDDLNWLLGIPSLRRLVLHNCMVVSRVRIDPNNVGKWRPRTEDWDAVSEEREEGDDWPQYAYHGRWSEFFARIARGLPSLVDFRFDNFYSSKKTYRYGVKNRDLSCGARVFPRRYLVFDNGILPTHWPEANDSGKLYSWTEGPFPNLHEERREDDQRGLDELLETCRQRVTGGPYYYHH